MGGGGGGGQRNFDSSGPDVKIRGTAAHIFDRYCQLARDATATGDRIGAENYLQHAEHYYRIMMASTGGRGNGSQPAFASPAPGSEGESEGESENVDGGEAEDEFADPATA